MLLLGIWHEKYTLRYIPITLMQVAYCAGTSFVLSAVQATSGPRLGRVALSSALSQAEQCIRYLLMAGQSFECANHVASILSNLLHDQLRPRLLMRTLEPKDLVSPDREGEYPQYPMPSENGVSGVTNDGPDIFSLATTIANLDALRDQCRSTAAAHSYSPDWNPQEGFPLMGGLAHQASASPSTSTSNAGASYNGQVPFDFSQLARMSEDVDMEFAALGGVGMGMDLGLIGGQPLSNRPFMHMAFDFPEFNAGPRVGPDAGFADIDAPPFDPQTIRQPAQAPVPVPPPVQQGPARAPPGMQVDFSHEELAMMDQLMRQQMAQNMAFQSSRF